MLVGSNAWADDWTLTNDLGGSTVRFKQQPVATLMSNGQRIKRPHFVDLHTANGRRITRHHPPIADLDLDDHADMHPGLWLAFGDLAGHDFWRNKGTVQSKLPNRQPTPTPSSDDQVGLAIINSYVADMRVLCRENCRLVFKSNAVGYQIEWSSVFTPDKEPVAFGDQEEMGLGIRLHTPLIEQRGGNVKNGDGLTTAAQVWGKQADWCMYGGTVDGRKIGVAIVPTRDNFRRSWFHVRDYGLLVANPFGQNAFTGGAKSSIELDPGKELRLAFTVVVFDVPVEQAGEVDRVLRTLSAAPAAAK